MTRLAVFLVTIVVAGCSLVATQSPATLREIAGTWQGRMALEPANASATLTIRDDGTYQGALHLAGGEDRPFSGAIVVVRPGRVRYHGSHGNGLIVLVERDGQVALRFVPDGGGGGGAFTRAR
jgi:hypothetical protein